ncbi:MAG: ATP-dependent DNA helicase RecQ [Kofleriaceae bacterium]|nr:ATP-dependent DNA helicase RecQ [Kofleriaceae bacterium]
MSALARHFGELRAFRQGQTKAIDRAVSGRNTICLMPTGGGKSLVYQVAGIRRGGTTLVISPLIALMGQQAQRLADRPGVVALSLSDFSGPKLYQKLRDLDFCQSPTFLFASPERVANDGFLEFLLRRNRDHINLIVVDEAHCVSQWGHTFRPPYKAIPRFLDLVFGANAWPPVLCLTATLNPRDLAEIQVDFRVADKDVLRTPTMLRTNLRLACEDHDDEEAKRARLVELLRAHGGEKVLVYVHRKKGDYGTRRLTKYLTELGIACDYFDSDRGDTEKDEVLARFEKGTLNVVLATSAFGMGIDIADIRVVIHYLLPESIEQYYQEVGRAGRDDRPAHGYLLFTATNVRIRKQLIQNSVPSRAAMEEFFKTKLASRPGDALRGLDPYQGLAEESGEVTTWFMLQASGVATVVAKGMAKVDCFSVPARTEPPSALVRYQAASRTGLVLGVARRLGEPVPEIVANLWGLFADGTLNLAASPMLTHFFTCPETLPTEALDAIEQDLHQKLEARLAGFDALVALVETGGDPTAGISAHLGLK